MCTSCMPVAFSACHPEVELLGLCADQARSAIDGPMPNYLRCMCPQLAQQGGSARHFAHIIQPAGCWSLWSLHESGHSLLTAH